MTKIILSIHKLSQRDRIANRRRKRNLSNNPNKVKDDNKNKTINQYNETKK